MTKYISTRKKRAVDQLIDARKSIVYRRRIKLTENRKIHRDVLFGKRLVSVVKMCIRDREQGCRQLR